MSRHLLQHNLRSVEDMLKQIQEIVELTKVMPFYTDEDRKVAETGMKDANSGFDLLNEVVSTLYFSDPGKAIQIAAGLDFLTHGLLISISKSTVSHSAFKAAEYKKSAEMRAAKIDDAKESVLVAAIESALIGKDISERGIASKILGTINKQLRAAGIDEVSRHVVARRLKVARSSRA